MAEVVLALFAHPDDEVLGCGGTLAKHVTAGAQVHARFLSTGVGSRKWKLVETDTGETSKRLAEMDAAAKVLGLATVAHADLPDQRFDTVPQLDINRQVEAWLAELKPTIVYTHSPHDLNRDHRITTEAVMVATRPLRYQPCAVLGCEIPGSMNGFEPVMLERMTADHMQTMSDALDKYQSEATAQRSAEYAECHRKGLGAMAGAHWMNQFWAEAFEVLRWVR